MPRAAKTASASPKTAASTRAPRKKPTAETVKVAPEVSAREAGLRYVHDDAPGISRRKSGSGFSYRDADGQTIRDRKTLARIKSLAIPPAYRDVWICPRENGHIQATGLDERGRKQYRYHAKWREVRDANKYSRMMAFGRALPAIRERAAVDSKQHGLPRERVLGTIVQLLEKTLIRVGNEQYSRDNKSYGLTTMKNRHIEVEGKHITFSFKGKSGVRHTIDLHDAHLARVLARISDLPGQNVFQYLDENGERHSVGSSEVNAYLKEISGEDFTAKDFRTWAGTVLASLALQECEKFDNQTQAKKNVVQAIERVAEKLGNTPAVCRKCYVHPIVVEAYLNGSLLDSVPQRAAEKAPDLPPDEAAVMRLLLRKLEEVK